MRPLFTVAYSTELDAVVLRVVCTTCNWTAVHRGGEPGEGEEFLTRMAEEHVCFPRKPA